MSKNTESNAFAELRQAEGGDPEIILEALRSELVAHGRDPDRVTAVKAELGRLGPLVDALPEVS